MIYIVGKRNARIATYVDKDHICYRCKAYEREIKVYRTYAHFCYIPVFPIGPKMIDIRCLNCGDETNTESLGKKYEKNAKTPFYLYSALILMILIGAYWFYWNKNNQKRKIEFVGNPAIGNVYTIMEEMQYSGFVSSLSDEDYFVKDDTVGYSKKELNNMLESEKIFSVHRNYGDGEGFNRIR